MNWSGVPRVEVPVAASEEVDADARGVFASDREVEIVFDVERALVRLCIDSRAAGVEGVEDVDRWRTRHRDLVVPGVAHLDVEFVERRSSEESLNLHPQLAVSVLPVVRPLRQVEAADAAVAHHVLLPLVLDAKRLHVRECVLDADGPEGVVGWARDEAEERTAVRRQRVDVGGGVGFVALEIQPQRCLARDDRPAHAAADPRDVLRRLRGGECVAGIEDVVPNVCVEVSVPGLHVWPGDDFDLHAAGIVVVGRERVGAESDLADVLAIRKAPAGETVDAKHRANATRHLFEQGLELVGVVRQLFDDSLVEHLRRLCASRLLRDSRVVDDHLLLKPFDLQRHGLVVPAAPDCQRRRVGREPLRIHAQLHVSDRQRRNDGDPAFVRGGVDRCAGRRCHGDVRRRNSGTRLVEDDDAQLRWNVRRRWCLREDRNGDR